MGQRARKRASRYPRRSLGFAKLAESHSRHALSGSLTYVAARRPTSTNESPDSACCGRHLAQRASRGGKCCAVESGAAWSAREPPRKQQTSQLWGGGSSASGEKVASSAPASRQPASTCAYSNVNAASDASAMRWPGGGNAQT